MASAAVAARESEIAERDAERHHQPDEDEQQPVHRVLERRARVAEGAGVAASCAARLSAPTAVAS